MTLIHNFEEDISVVVPAQYFLTFADELNIFISLILLQVVTTLLSDTV